MQVDAANPLGIGRDADAVAGDGRRGVRAVAAKVDRRGRVRPGIEPVVVVATGAAAVAIRHFRVIALSLIHISEPTRPT